MTQFQWADTANANAAVADRGNNPTLTQGGWVPTAQDDTPERQGHTTQFDYKSKLMALGADVMEQQCLLLAPASTKAEQAVVRDAALALCATAYLKYLCEPSRRVGSPRRMSHQPPQHCTQRQSRRHLYGIRPRT